MGTVKSILDNKILVNSAIAWFLAQLIKVFTNKIKKQEFTFALFVASGGMPSSHSAAVCAMSASAAMIMGVNSPEFGIAFILSIIVMYDAAGVRRAAGEQAKTLNRLIKHIISGQTDILNKDLKELIGHTPFEVFAGAALGILIALISFWIEK